MFKTCTKCKEEKPLNQFNVCRGKPRAYCKACHKVAVYAWTEANKERRRIYFRDWQRRKNADHPKKWTFCKDEADRKARHSEANKRWTNNNKERHEALRKLWVARNPGKRLAITREYQARKIRAFPKWADRDAIEAMYEWAGRLAACGLRVEVDHIVPLKGSGVCGLHVEHNLQIIPMSANRSKRNFHWPDMPAGKELGGMSPLIPL